jgi:GT2 family glycosyltransferase
MQLSVIIVNYNVKYFLEHCLLSVLYASKNVKAEIFVVDNLSQDGSVEMVKEKFPWVKLIANKENVGFSKANNQAIKIAKGEYILLLNPDTVVEEACFNKVVSFMDQTPDAGAVGVKMIDGSGKFLPESKRGLPTPDVAFYKIFGLAALFPKSKRFGKYHLGFLDKNETHKVDVLAGAFMMVRKEIIEVTKGFDEVFFMYGEDIDLSYRIQKGGYNNVYFPETRIIHYKGESTKKSSVNYVFVFYKAMIIFAKKHFSQKNAKLFSFFIHLAIYFRAFLVSFTFFISRRGAESQREIKSVV